MTQEPTPQLHSFDWYKDMVFAMLKARGFGRQEGGIDQKYTAYLLETDAGRAIGGTRITFRCESTYYMTIEIQRTGLAKTLYSLYLNDASCIFCVSGDTLNGRESIYIGSPDTWMEALDLSLQSKHDLLLVQRVRERHLQAVAAEQAKVTEVDKIIDEIKKSQSELPRFVKPSLLSSGPTRKPKKQRSPVKPYAKAAKSRGRPAGTKTVKM